MRRAASRRTHIHNRHEEYTRTHSVPRARSATASPVADRMKPHRLARVAKRGLVAKNLVEVGSDMPSIISTKGRSGSGGWRKPSVGRVTSWQVSGADEEPVVWARSPSKAVQRKCSFDFDSETTATESIQSEVDVSEAETSEAEVVEETGADADGMPAIDETKDQQFEAAVAEVEEVAVPPVCTARERSQEQHRAAEMNLQKAELEAREMKASIEVERKAMIEQVQALKTRAEIESRVIKARAEMESREMKATIEAERKAMIEQVQALKTRAEIESRVIKARAEMESREMKATIEAERKAMIEQVQALKTCAEIEFRVIKVRAEMEAREMMASIEAERQAMLEQEANERSAAEARAQQEAAAKERAAAEAEQRAKVAAQKEAAAVLQKAKAAEKQRAKEFRRKGEQERRLEEARGRAHEAERAGAKEESRALLAQAWAEASELKARARAEAEEIRAGAEDQARAIAEETARKAKAQSRALRELVEGLHAQAAEKREGPNEVAAEESWEMLSEGGSVQEAHLVAARAAADDADDWSLLDL
mmetsp:Transcript_156820/g.503280  ORF Transcript_156820/g.503280 Transcript_156820/m.503280 type:complete len:539 (-) Transcript_156820:85-1701(-)